NIRDTESALDYFSGFRVRDYEVLASGDTLTGVIAQEVLETHPELVHMGDEGLYRVDQINTWKVVKALQELNVKVDELSLASVGTDTGFETHESLFERVA